MFFHNRQCTPVRLKGFGKMTAYPQHGASDAEGDENTVHVAVFEGDAADEPTLLVIDRGDIDDLMCAHMDKPLPDSPYPQIIGQLGSNPACIHTVAIIRSDTGDPAGAVSIRTNGPSSESIHMLPGVYEALLLFIYAVRENPDIVLAVESELLHNLDWCEEQIPADLQLLSDDALRHFAERIPRQRRPICTDN